MTNTLKSSEVEKLSRRMVAEGNSFECALGHAMLQGNYSQRCKIMSAFDRLIERFMPWNK